MKFDLLLEPKAPWLHLLQMTESEAYDRMRAIPRAGTPSVAARLIRGQKATTAAGLFNEFAAALQFPPYFGENWDAFDECLNDLDWLHTDAYVLMILNAVRVLEKGSSEEARQFWALLARTGAEWAKAIAGPRPRSAKAFHAVLQCTQEEEARLRKELKAAQVAYHVIQ
jgi:hypothetical protein